jgi:hypothetical protein
LNPERRSDTLSHVYQHGKRPARDMGPTQFIDGSPIADKPLTIAQRRPVAVRLLSTLSILLPCLSLVLGIRGAESGTDNPHEKDQFKDAKQRPPGAQTTHWSFQAVRRPPVPADRSANRTSGSSSPIDRFVAAKLGESLGIRPSADRRTLMRRVYFDLLGLPPAPEEVEAFGTDDNPRAYEQLVERLLQSPHYGERWGRHWLDVAGFAESSMFISDVPRQGFWRYRDYVIRAFNEDKPYDRFIIEQLAGDELFNWRTAETFTEDQINLLAATGFLRCTPDATDNQAITQMDKRYIAQQTAVEVSMKALMGLTINCVRCHDHKFDPISQEEYYRLSAIFQPAYDPENWLPGIWSAPYVGSLRAIPLLPRTERQDLMRQSLRWFAEYQALSHQVRGGLEREYRDRWLKEHPDRFTNEAARLKFLATLEQTQDERGTDGEKQLTAEAQRLELTSERLRELFPEFARRYETATNRIEELKKGNGRFKEDVIWCLFDVTTNPSPTHLLKRGNYESPGPVVAPGVIAVIDKPDRRARFDQPPGDWTTGRRRALASWLVHPEHPLVARVIVNRIWQYHFGVGLVSTPDDFGARGSRPASQELLDWMASEFIAHGWSVKYLHRLIMNSATYRQETVLASEQSPGSLQATNPGTDHAPERIAAFVPGPRRLEAEAIRDSMLEISGLLDRRMFGPSVPTERRADGSFDLKAGHPDRRRRSVYIHTRRTYVPTVLTLFDEPQMDSNWPKRSTSAIAQQALALMHDPFVIECAGAFASRVKAEGGDTFSGRLARAFALAYQRAPTPEETEEFQQRTADIENPWPFICQALLSSSEFLYVD